MQALHQQKGIRAPAILLQFYASGTHKNWDVDSKPSKLDLSLTALNIGEPISGTSTGNTSSNP